jgi:hypothetical protein
MECRKKEIKMSNVIKMPREQSTAASVYPDQAPVRGYSDRFSSELVDRMEKVELLANLGYALLREFRDYVLLDSAKFGTDLQLRFGGHDEHTGQPQEVIQRFSEDEKRMIPGLSELWANAPDRLAFLGDTTNMIQLQAYENPVHTMAYDSVVYTHVA